MILVGYWGEQALPRAVPSVSAWSSYTLAYLPVGFDRWCSDTDTKRLGGFSRQLMFAHMDSECQNARGGRETAAPRARLRAGAGLARIGPLGQPGHHLICNGGVNPPKNANPPRKRGFLWSLSQAQASQQSAGSKLEIRSPTCAVGTIMVVVVVGRNALTTRGLCSDLRGLIRA